MNYNKLIKTVSLIIENDLIYKDGLIITYMLDEDIHKRMNEELFNKTNSINEKLVYNNEFEVEIGGILIKFIKKV